jgi:hypothetical protein
MFTIEMKRDFIILRGFLDISLFTNNKNLIEVFKKYSVQINYFNKLITFKIPRKLSSEESFMIIKLILEKDYNLMPYHMRIKND